MPIPLKEIAGQKYIMIVASDVAREKIFLEARDESYSLLAEIFWDDSDERINFTAFQKNLPLTLIEFMIEWARNKFTPTAEQGS